MTKLIKLLSLTCALAVSTAVASAHCGKCEKKDHPATPTAPATAPVVDPAKKDEPAKQEEAPAKKDGEKCPCPSEKPKALVDLTSDDCPKKCDKDKKDAPAAPAAPATAEEAPAAPAKKDGEKKCPSCPDEKPKA
jgi:hypothetical protein